MTLVSIPRGFYYPYQGFGQPFGDNLTVDATGEKIAMMGRCYISGRPTTSKTISAAGGGSISFYIKTLAWGNNSSTVDFGIVGVSASTPPQPSSSTLDVKRTYTSNANALTGSTWTTISMTGGSGTKTISHGDLIAVVIDMTLRNSTDAVNISALNAAQYLGFGSSQQQQGAFPGTNSFISGAWGAGGGFLPNVVITFDDGTIATLDGGGFYSAMDQTAWNDGNTPDERGNIFQVPFNCKIDALASNLLFFSATASDFDFKLYSTPLGTPTSIASFSVTAEQATPFAFGAPSIVLPLATEVALTKGVDYCLAIKATGASEVGPWFTTLGNTAYRTLLPAGTTLRKGTRDNSTGAFTEESPAVTVHNMFVRISQVDDGTGTGTSRPTSGLHPIDEGIYR